MEDATQSLVQAWSTDIEIENVDGHRSPVVGLMLAGELSPSSEEATSMHRVVRSFDPPKVLVVEGKRVLSVAAIAAIVGEVEADPFDVRVGGRERLAWMLKNTLNGVRAWFTDDKDPHHRVTPPMVSAGRSTFWKRRISTG